MDHIETGNVGPGGVAGSGRVEAGEIAGRDVAHDATQQNVNIILDRIQQTAKDESVTMLANLVWALHQERAAQHRQDIAELRHLLLENGLVSRVGKLEATLEAMANILAQLRTHPLDCPYLKTRDQEGEVALYRRDIYRLVTNTVIAVALVALVTLLAIYLANGGTL